MSISLVKSRDAAVYGVNEYIMGQNDLTSSLPKKCKPGSTAYKPSTNENFIFTPDNEWKKIEIQAATSAGTSSGVSSEVLENYVTNTSLTTQLSNKQDKITSTNLLSYDLISGKPTLSTVAISGSYNDLTNKPTIPSIDNLATKTELNAKQDKISTSNKISYDCIYGTPDLSNISIPSDTYSDQQIIELLNNSNILTTLSFNLNNTDITLINNNSNIYYI